MTKLSGRPYAGIQHQVNKNHNRMPVTDVCVPVFSEGDVARDNFSTGITILSRPSP